MARNNKTTRRTFLGGAAASGVALSGGCGSFNIVPRWVMGGPRYVPASEKMHIAVIGVGGKGFSDMMQCSSENIVAICDCDEKLAEKALKAQPKAKHYFDYREMLDKEKGLDAVIVATPDHTHAPASMRAMAQGLHVYCQKPLTHDVAEARAMREMAKKHNIVTQMGNQGTALDGLRRAVEIVQDGVIGDVTEVHVWTNRPIWPQGMKDPLPGVAVPSSLKWDLFIGTAPMREYNPGYTPFKWRGWWDYGTGALGDMACHTANMAFMALKLGYPTSISAETRGLNTQTFPHASTITFQFPAREKMPPVKFMWYDGGNTPSQDLAPGENFKQIRSGSLLVGSKGTLYSPNDYGAEFKLLKEKDFEGLNLKTPERIPSSPKAESDPGGGDNDLRHKTEWIRACKGQGTTMSNFDYAAFLTETILLGNVAMRVGKPMDWDGPGMRSPNCPEAAQYVRREYNKSFQL